MRARFRDGVGYMVSPAARAMMVSHGRTRDGVKKASVSRDAAMAKVLKDISTMAGRLARPAKTRDDEGDISVKKQVFKGPPGSYVTMTDADGSFCVFRLPDPKVEQTTVGTKDATAARIRDANARNANFWSAAK